ncbi:hypothetical protein A9Q93_09095 [Nonlabens dokdonensis]|uniref:Integrase catalytic domain-containing protein n=1 Tax=Nonlabens dokdonensis TaxID=328515 RepID=A0A1Z8ATB4_9FLAO|nr:integrase core domain-containing protein [Nonlabens dokdonensis]OUS13587.1 hypothetical protein A9Q93_09095 [Nonlabens dokdonensis]
MIEALNKVIKHQFLFHQEITSREQLTKYLNQTVIIYNELRPQMNLGGNTPLETFNGLSIDLSQYTRDFKEQKQLRILTNRKNACTLYH